MNHGLLAALLLAAAPAFAAPLASSDEWNSQQSSLEGLYAGIGGGGNLLIVPGDNSFGYDAELRLGYSFNPLLAVYLSGSVDGASLSGRTFRSGEPESHTLGLEQSRQSTLRCRWRPRLRPW